ncbi:hypothetical protein FA95DRAFT_1577787 [Auriscalpium vulgare]|uniref:Uncharacterized protein n=1 Tax=Auriscalpium vulgare TaxID=40419 RepID=A0ACB8R676_9AGAM|nr:hypothetical protein FA95DRAFT_1577787 [Auriscalpium vulgare]
MAALLLIVSGSQLWVPPLPHCCRPGQMSACLVTRPVTLRAAILPAMPNALSRIIFNLNVEPLGLITIIVLVAPNGRLSVTYDWDPEASTFNPDMPAAGPPIVRTVNVVLQVADNANRSSCLTMTEGVALVQGVAAVLGMPGSS